MRRCAPYLTAGAAGTLAPGASGPQNLLIDYTLATSRGRGEPRSAAMSRSSYGFLQPGRRAHAAMPFQKYRPFQPIDLPIDSGPAGPSQHSRCSVDLRDGNRPD